MLMLATLRRQTSFVPAARGDVPNNLYKYWFGPSTSINALTRLAFDLPSGTVHEGYLVEIARDWRRFARQEAAREYESAWEYLVGGEMWWEY